MKRLIIYCEGDTEESFVNKILYDYLLSADIYTTPIVHTTKRTSTAKCKGGVSSYGKIKRELERLCKGDQTAAITTMFDYYALPDDTPGIATASGDIFDKAKHIEKAIEDDMGGLRNLFFNLIVHEYEGLLFTDTSAFECIVDVNSDTVAKLQEIKDSFESPEHINNSPTTAPSKRIREIVPRYRKPIDGILIAKHIGINAISAQCKHFKNWIDKIVSFEGRLP